MKAFLSHTLPVADWLF